MVPRFSRSYGCLTVVLQFVILSQSDRARVMRKLEHVFWTTPRGTHGCCIILQMPLPLVMSGILSESWLPLHIVKKTYDHKIRLI